MARRRRRGPAEADESQFEDALEALPADGLRATIRDLLPWLEGDTQQRLVHAVLDAAARTDGDWRPDTPSADQVARIVAAAAHTARTEEADPAVVDGYLRAGADAFLGRGYEAAQRIYGAWLPVLTDGFVDCGQHEMLDEVLGMDLGECAAHYAVACYMCAAPAGRPEAVHAAITSAGGLGHCSTPLARLEQIAVEPLPQFAEFVPQWRAHLEARERSAPEETIGTEHGRWRREVVERLEGTDGLATLARKTGAPDDFRAWTDALVARGDWAAAHAAFSEAADAGAGVAAVDGLDGTGESAHYTRAGFCDGAALAAQELGRKDFPAHLERAWRAAPTMTRLCRWLGTAATKAALRRRAGQALAACPKDAERQRGWLLLLTGKLAPAAGVLADASGLGWSGSEHPGHLLFPLFTALRARDDDGESANARQARAIDSAQRSIDTYEITQFDDAPPRGPRLPELNIGALCELAEVFVPVRGVDRDAIRAAIRGAAETRIAGVVEAKRRRHYAHAASLVYACAAAEPSDDAAEWVARIRQRYRRYPALQRELAAAADAGR